MAITSAAALEALFQEGDAPTSADFAAVFDSFLHKVSAAGTAQAVRSLGAGAVGSALFSTITTASAYTEIGLPATFGAATTAQMSAATNTSSAFVTPGKQHYHPLMPKAWVNFNGVGTVSIRDGWNVPSVGDLGAGLYRVTWGSAFPNTNYAPQLTNTGAPALNSFPRLVTISAGDFAIGDIKVRCVSVSANGDVTAANDTSVMSVLAISR